MMQKKLKLPTGEQRENGPPVLVVHYVAVFARDSFTVQFELNGALDAEGKSDVTGEMLPQKFHDPNSKDQLTTLRKNEFKRPGYVFTGWAESKTGQGRTYADEAPFAEVTTYRELKLETTRRSPSTRSGKNCPMCPSSTHRNRLRSVRSS